MPTYQYACTECGHDLEAVQSFSDPALTDCPQCSGRLRKVFSSVGIVFKGSGFYRTDSREPVKTSVGSDKTSDGGSEKSSDKGDKSSDKSSDKKSDTAAAGGKGDAGASAKSPTASSSPSSSTSTSGSSSKPGSSSGSSSSRGSAA